MFADRLAIIPAGMQFFFENTEPLNEITPLDIIEEFSSESFHARLGESSSAQSEYGDSGAHRLQGDDSEVLYVAEDRPLGIPVILVRLFPVLVSDEFDVVFRDRLEMLAMLPVSDDEETFLGHPVEGVHGDIDPLEFSKGSDDDVIFPLRDRSLSYGEDIRIHGRVDEMGIPTVILLDPLLHRLRIRNQQVSALSCQVVPHPQTMEDVFEEYEQELLEEEPVSQFLAVLMRPIPEIS